MDGQRARAGFSALPAHAPQPRRSRLGDPGRFRRGLQDIGEIRQPAIQEPAKWLTRVAFNTCYDRLRSKRWRFWQRHSTDACGDALLRITPAVGPNQEDAAAALDIRRRLERALDRLSVRQRAVFILRHDEDRSVEEIARIMSLDAGTVKAHMARAIKKLREELRDLYVR